MKARLLIWSMIFILCGTSAESQILKKLKKKVEQTSEKVLLKKTEEKTEKTVEGAIDGVANPGSKSSSANDAGSNSNEASNKDANTAKLKNSQAKRAFYTSDVVVRTSDSKGPGSEYYFDSDEIAAKGLAPNNKKPIFIDSEGYQYGYNESAQRWEKTGLMKSDAMSFMMPMMSVGMLKLPVGPTLDASEKMKNEGLNLNTFQIVEWAFIYKPEHFRNADYEETTAPCPNGGSCTKFLYTETGYKGSWVLFDNQGRLSEVYANVDTQQAQGSGSYKFSYEPVSVTIPNAVEVKTPFQDLFMVGADATPPGENRSGQNTTPSDYGNSDSESRSQNSMGSVQQDQGNRNVGADELRATYDFDWEYNLKLEMINQKEDPLDLVFLLKKNTDYQGVKIKNPKAGNLDEATMVFDMNINSLLMFVESEGTKFLQIHPMKNPNKAKEIGKLEIRELPDKNIMGYNSKGMEIENDEFIAQVYHTNEAPIEMSNLFNFSGPMKMNMPDIDPRLVKQFSKGLITEMRYTDKKKSKNNVLITGLSLNEVKTRINKNEYQNMSFMSQFKTKNN